MNLFSFFNDLITFLINPIILLWTLILVGFICKIRKKKYYAIFFRLSILWLFIISISPIPIWLIKSLEQQNNTISLNQFKVKKEVYVLVLGSGQTNDTALTHLNRLGNSALFRLTEGIRIHKQLPNSKLVFSGFSNGKKIPQARMLSLAALELGICPKDTLQLVNPSNTEEEALAFKKRFGSMKNIIIVTSAVHMPRAVLLFKAQKLNCFAAPTFNYVKKDYDESVKWFSPSIGKMEMMEKGIHEYVGIIYVHVKKWF